MDNKNLLADITTQLNAIPLEERDKHSNDEPPLECNVCANRDKLDQVDHAQDIWLKERFSSHVLAITYIWLTFLVGIFIATGISNLALEKPYASDTVLITLVSGTSFSVIIGMLSIILRHLFAGKKK